METDLLFRYVLGILFAAFVLMRLYFLRRSRTLREGWFSRREGRGNGIRLLLALGGGAIFFFRIFDPALVTWSELPLPPWLRWAGAGLGAAGFLLLTWAQALLAENFSPTLRIRTAQRLITSGPYHVIRHPIYTAFLLLFIGFFLLSADWMIGLLGVVLVVYLLLRTPKEEAMMLESFGEEYRRYMQQTGRYFPRWRSRAKGPTDSALAGAVEVAELRSGGPSPGQPA